MINFLLDRSKLIGVDYLVFRIPLNEISEMVIFKSSNPFYYTYTDNKLISINFRIIDLGTCYKVTVYKNTNYTVTMSESDIEGYLREIVFSKFEEEVAKQFSNFIKTKSIPSPEPTGVH